MRKQNGHLPLPPADGRLPPEAYDNLPRVAITLTDESAYLTRFDPAGNPSLTYPVAIGDIAQSFSRFGADTGLLPENTLFWQQTGDGIRIGIWLPPATHALAFEVGRGEIKIQCPLPGAVFVGKGTRYAIYAALARPASAQAQLYRYPLPNVDAGICFGNVHPPKCSPETIAAAAKLFFESTFNLHLSEGKIQEQVEEQEPVPGVDGPFALWDEDDEDEDDGYNIEDLVTEPAERGETPRRPRKVRSLLDFLKTLKGQAEFPSAQLVPECTMQQVIKRG